MHKIILQYYIFPEKKKTFLQAINVWVMEYSSLSSDLDKNLILFLTLCVGLCGPFTGGESWVNFSLSFCSPFSLSFTYSPQEWKNKTKHNAALCLIVCHHICLSREFFFPCLTVANSGPILLFCSLIQVTWSQWKQKHRPKDFRGSVWMLFTSVNSVWKLVCVEELKVTLAQVASEKLCSRVSFFCARFDGVGLSESFFNSLLSSAYYYSSEFSLSNNMLSNSILVIQSHTGVWWLIKGKMKSIKNEMELNV